MHVNITVHFSTLMTTLASITFTAVRKVAYLYSEPANSTLRVHFVEHGYITIHGRRGMLMIMVYKPPVCVRGPRWSTVIHAWSTENREKSDLKSKSKIEQKAIAKKKAKLAIAARHGRRRPILQLMVKPTVSVGNIFWQKGSHVGNNLSTH